MKTVKSLLAISTIMALVACGGGGGTAPTNTNTAPVASAGNQQSLMTGSIVTLDGSGSTDAEHDTLTYSWTLTSKPVGSNATLSSATNVKPTFTADLAGSYTATLIVSDGKSNSNAVTVTVTASLNNAAPIANAGNNQSVVTGTAVTLDGSNSSDVNGDALTYIWSLTSKPAGSTATLSSATSARPTFTADVAGTYAASLSVNDGQLNSNMATVSVTATRANAAPVANAGAAQSVVTGNTVTLDGSASSDANGDPLTYSWTLTSKPTGNAATLSSTTSARPTFNADIAGTYVASLTVNDGQLNSNTATISVTAARANAAPVANAGTAQSVVTGNTVTLDGSASSDANGDPLTYSWTLTSKPTGSAATLSSTTSARPTFNADIAGTYVASLTVNDGTTGSPASAVSVTAITPSLTLYQVADSLFGGGDTLQALPYSSAASASATIMCAGSGCETYYKVATFKLVASQGRSYTITNLTATNLTTGSTITPSFGNLANNQVINAGQSVSFELRSPFTNGQTVNLRYSFSIQETGQTFSYAVGLRTN